MTKITPPRGAERARERIAQIRQELGDIELLCSGTLLKRMEGSDLHWRYYEKGVI